MSAILMSDTLPPLEKVMEVNEFFRGRSVFITGGSGFMGKVLLEKLLWSCQDIGCVYMLLRENRKQTVEERLQNILELPIFDRIRKKNPMNLRKIIPIQGNSMELNLGICNDDIRTLENNVSVVFHFAATVKFAEPLKRAILLNVRGTRECVDLARNMKNLKAFMHVSTVYTNTDKAIIEEKVVTKNANWRSIIKIAEELDEYSICCLQDKMKGYHPNTYTYTKYLAENIVDEYRNEIPAAILRPSIVVCCIKDPLPGWVDDIKGYASQWYALMTGVLHVIYGQPSVVNDYIPCDHCADAIIVATAYRGNCKCKESIVINVASGDMWKTNLVELFNVAYKIIDTVPFERMLWDPYICVVKNRFLYRFLVIVLHVIPAIIFDAVFKVSGVKFSLLEAYRRIFSLCEYLGYFCINHWKIVNNNCVSLKSFIHPNDRKMFQIDFTILSDADLLHKSLSGIKKFILKEEFTDEALNRAKTRLNRLRMANMFVKLAIVSFFLLMFYKFILAKFL